jgi:hypothetical protein
MAKAKANPRTCFVEPFLKITAAMLHEVMVEVIEANSAFIEELNRKQLSEGKRADGKAIVPPYTQATIAIKKENNQQAGWVTLFDEGDFYQSIYTNVFKDSFELTADDPKTEQLREKYGDLIFGLTPENKQKLIDHIRPQFMAKVRQRIGFK